MTDTRPILLVEDNPDDRALTLRAIHRNQIGNLIIAAVDGVEALDYLFAAGKGQPFPPALVLLDLKLPRVDGLEVLRRIREGESTRLLPVVILTTSREPRDIVDAYRLGANSYIRKPVDFEEFVRAIGQLGSYWLGLNQIAP